MAETLPPLSASAQGTQAAGVRIAQIYLLDVPYAIDRPFDYFVPPHLRESVCRGRFVVVPFGGGNRKMLGYVAGVNAQDGPIRTDLKPVLSCLHAALTLPQSFEKLCFFLKEQTFCSVGEAVRAMLPAAAFSRLNEVYSVQDSLAKGAISSLKPKALRVFRFIEEQKHATLLSLRSAFGVNVNKLLTQMEADGFLKKETDCKEHRVLYTVTWHLQISKDQLPDALSSLARAKKRTAVLSAFPDMDGQTTQAFIQRFGERVTDTLESLTQKGFLRKEQTDRYRNPYAATHPQTPLSPPPLSTAQTAAFSALRALYDPASPHCALLYGVTGSGKTQVIRAMIDHVLASGRQVILLVPEISLTPQTVQIFSAYYGDQIAVLHSVLSDGERYDAWRRIKNGEVKLCIGTRSAVFAPFPHLGLIVMDEEQEATYKSDNSPRYHARDVARFRCANEGAMLLLASATPSLESYYKAQTGVYTLVSLTERFGDAKLPTVEFADLRQDNDKEKASPLGNRLYQRLREVKQAGQQAVLFVNRRGYHSVLTCTSCGTAVTCPHCSVSLTFHKRRGAQEGKLLCHYCGYQQTVPLTCPACGKHALAFLGFGTQYAEEALQKALPDAKILRMDADTTANKFAYDAMLEQFRRADADILLGTQMVAKGHDFPKVTLVGVLLAELSLYVDDFRAAERTFSLLTQVIGRAGRAKDAGYALIQTYDPENPVLQMAKTQDYTAFYENEIALRRSLVFPPFCDLCAILFTAREESALLHATTAFYQALRAQLAGDFSDVQLLVFGPMEAPVYKVNEKYRMRLLLKCRFNARTRALLRTMYAEFSDKFARKVTLAIDVNPTAL